MGGVICLLLTFVPLITANPYLQLTLQIIFGFLAYTGTNKLLGSTIQQDIFNTIGKKLNLRRINTKKNQTNANDSMVE